MQGYAVFTTLLAHEPRDHLTHTGITALNADVTNDDDVKSLREVISDKTGGQLDILVNNAYVIRSP